MPTSYLLKITLKNVSRPIWRRFVVPSNIKLHELHDVIQNVMGWCDCHLHAFIVGNQYYKSTEVIDLDSYDDEDEDEDGDLPEENYLLQSLVSKKGAKIKYWYDFGDNWKHEIVVESVDYMHPDWPYPIYCLEGVRACPPEDCGSASGFARFCEAMADPKHPKHRDVKAWFGGKYDPDHFDLDAVNKSLGVERTRAPKKKIAKETSVKKVAKKTTKATTKKTTKKTSK